LIVVGVLLLAYFTVVDVLLVVVVGGRGLGLGL